MTQNELDKILKNHKKWLSDEEGGRQADLRAADIRAADLRAAALRAAALRAADLQAANLQAANLWGADLRAADLQSAYLQAANLRAANLRAADFQAADLRGADLRGVDFQAADLRGANIDYSCWPLWCGSLDVIVDRRIFCQLAYHLCRVIVDDDDCKTAQLMLGRLANEFHRVDECGRVPETPKEEQHETSL